MSLNLESLIPKEAIKVSFFDTDGTKVDNISVEQANEIAKTNPEQKFLFQTGDGTQQELSIDQVNALQPQNLLPTVSECPTGPQQCGPPLVQFFGGGGFGAAANAIVSPISSSIIAFDIVNPGKNYTSPPSADLVDSCGNGSGATVTVNVQPVSTSIGPTGTSVGNNAGLQIKNIAVDSPGDGYLPAPNGSLGGNERVWKEPDEGYVLTANGEYYVVAFNTEPTLNEGDTYFPPSQPATPQSIYPILLAIDEIKISNPGFGYKKGDKIIINPDKGAVLEPIINDRGQIEKVNVINPGLGFDDLPEIKTNSPTGFNAQLIPILKVVPLEEVEQVPVGVAIISVVDCVGKIPPKVNFSIAPQ